MTPDQTNKFQAAMKLATEQFQSTLVHRILDIEALMIEIDSGEDAAPRLRTISAMAHKTAGVAPTLKHTRLGELALDIETQSELLATLDDATVSWSHFRPKLTGFLDAMEAALDAE